MENIVHLTKINKIHKLCDMSMYVSWIEIRRGLNIFLNAYLKTIATNIKTFIGRKYLYLNIF